MCRSTNKSLKREKKNKTKIDKRNLNMPLATKVSWTISIIPWSIFFSNLSKGVVEVLIYQCNGLLPSLSGTSGSAFHFETMW